MSSPPRSSIKKRKTPNSHVQFQNEPLTPVVTPEKKAKLELANAAAAAAAKNMHNFTPERKRTLIETHQIIDRQYKLTMREIDETIKIAVQIISNNSAPTVKILTQLDTAKENITVPLAKFKALHPPSKYITLIDTEMAKMNSLLEHAKKPKTTPFVINNTKQFTMGTTSNRPRKTGVRRTNSAASVASISNRNKGGKRTTRRTKKRHTHRK